MTIFIQNNATGAGAGNVNAGQVFTDLTVISNGDTGLGLAAAVGNTQQVTYARTDPGAPATSLAQLVNNVFTPNYGAGAQTVNIIIIGAGANFTLNDGTLISNIAGAALPPGNTTLAGNTLNTTNNCLVIYDTSQANGNGYCVARAGTGGTLDLAFANPTILYHELSHALRIVNNGLLALTAACDPSSPEENAAIVDENVMRTQSANNLGIPVVLRDPGIHCGAAASSSGCTPDCCIIASVASRSPISTEVQTLRAVRDRFLRATEVGHAFFESLLRDYYAFSPQICRIMAPKPELSELVLDGYVRPLMVTLSLMQGSALDGTSGKQLGEAFAAKHSDHAAAARTLALLERMAAVIHGAKAGGKPIVGDLIPAEFMRLLEEYALPSAHVRWALIEPVQMYGEALEAHLAGRSASQVGRALHRSFTAWAEQMPIDEVWASLSAKELERELRFFESHFLPTARATKTFRRRLAERFDDITAVQRVLGLPCSVGGGL